MSEQTFDASRRRFFAQVAVVGAATVLTTAPQASRAQTLPELGEAEPTAAALGYKTDTTKVDNTKYPNHKPEQKCSNCNLAQGADGDELRPCSIFPGKAVHANGWCAAWVAKA